MIVTKIEPINTKKCRIYLNDEPAFWLYSGELFKYQIKEETELSQEQQEELYRTVLAKRAKLRCMNLLKVMDKAEEELRRKLRREEYPESVIEEALEYVKSYHYVDDLRYARNYIDWKKESKSRQQIEYELLGKGVSSELIRQAWEETEPVDVSAQILRWAEKKHFDILTEDSKERQKFYQFLLRKGFLYSDIKKALT